MTAARSSGYLIVFLSNKLVTCDTVVPLVLDVHARNPTLRIEFYIVDWRSFQIIKENRVLWDAIHLVGSLTVLGRSPEQRAGRGPDRLRHLIKAGFRLARLAFLGLTGKAKFLHFRALNEWPLRALYYVAPSRTYLCEPIVTGYSENERRVDNAARARTSKNGRAAAGSRLVAFSPDWDQLSAPHAAHCRKFVLGKFWYGCNWPRFVYETADRYLEAEFCAASMPFADKIIVYILGYLGAADMVPSERTFKEKLSQTLAVLHEEAPGMPVLIKPHFNTDIEYVRNAISAFPGNKFLISHLHPAVLATRACFFIGNYYSTTMAVARAFGVPVIEFSEYNKVALEITGGRGMRPDIVDHYVNNDTELLRKTIRTILDRNVAHRRIPHNDDLSGIVEELAGAVT